MKHPISYAAREIIAGADVVLGLPAFVAETVVKDVGEAAKGLGINKQAVDKYVADSNKHIQDVAGTPATSLAVWAGMDKKTLEEAKINQAMGKVGEGAEWASKKVSDVTGATPEQSEALVSTAILGLGEMFGKFGGKVADKTGLTDKVGKLTDPSKAELDKYKANKERQDQEYAAFEKRKAEEPPVEPEKPRVDKDTGEILGKVERTEEQKTKQSAERLGVKPEEVGDIVGSIKELRKQSEEFVGPKQPTNFEELMTHINKPEVKKQMQANRDRYFEQSGVEPLKAEQPSFKTWDNAFMDQIGFHLAKLDIERANITQFGKMLREMTPEAADRSKVYEAIQRGKIDQLPKELQPTARLYENTMKKWGEQFLEAKVIKGMLQDYATRIVDMRGQDPALLEKVLSEFEQKQASFPVTGKFGKQRLHENYDAFLQALEQGGLKLKTTDIAQVAEEYGNTMFKAKLNKELIDKLSKFELPDGSKVFIDTKKPNTHVPYNYKRITAGMYDGYAVHPDMLLPLKFVIDSSDMGMVMRGLNTLSSITKRINVGYSLFHATTLNVGRAFSLGVKDNLKSYTQLTKAYDNAFKSGELKAWQDVNLKLGAEADAGLGVMDHVAKSVDDFLYKTGGFEGDAVQKTVKAASKPQQLLDHITWDIIHDGSKLVTANALLEKAMIDHPHVPERFLREQIATHVNDVYGGIDWFGAARDSNKYLQNLKMNMFSPEGRRYLQIVEFAPDWTLSTLRVFARALPKINPLEWNITEGLAGLRKPLTSSDHARQYQVRALMYMLTISNGLNMALSGHSIFENKDFFSIELGDGRAIHPFKHYSEAYHWLGDFNKTFTNKLGFVPRMVLKTRDQTNEQALAEVAKSVLPFSVTAGKGSVAQGVAGFLGVPLTGTEEGHIGGKGLAKNLERVKNKLERKLGMKIIDDEEDDQDESSDN
jgi:hypothetical protein